MAAAKLLDLVQVTTSTIGTGTLTLGAAVAPYLTMALAGAVDGSTYTYAINDLGTQSEIGRGVWTSASNTLTRTVLVSTNSNAAISLSGSAVVRITPAAEDLVLLDGAGTTNGIPYYTASRGIASTAALTDGQLVVGQTGSAPLPKTMGGDATLSALAALTLASVISAAGPIGSATVTPVITYDAKGRLTTVTQATIAPPFSAITGTAAVTQGGTGTATAFTTGAIVFAGASGVYSQDTALSWDNTLKRLNLNISGSSPFAAETNTQFVLTGADGTAATAFWYSFGSPCAIDMMHASGTRAARTATATGSTIGQINFQGYDTVTATNDGYVKSARLRSVAVPSGATFTSADHGTDLLFLTTAPGTITLSEKVRVTGTGDLNISSGGGITIASAATSGNVLRGNGTRFVSSQLAAADLSNGVTGSGAVVLATSPAIATPTITTSAVIPLIGPPSNSTTAVKITKADLSTAVMTFDTTNARVGINKTPGAFDLDVNGAVNLASTLNVGTGTSVPSGSALTVSNNSGAIPSVGATGFSHFVNADGSATVLKLWGAGVGASGQINFLTSQGTLASPTATQSADGLGGYFGFGYGTSYQTNGGAGFTILAVETFGASAGGTKFAISTTATGATTRGVAATFHGSKSLSVGNANDPGAGAIYANTSITAHQATAIPAGGTAGAGLMVSSTASFGVFFGSGAPSLSAAKGSLYLRSDGTTTNDRAYINSNGSTTWTALTTAA